MEYDEKSNAGLVALIICINILNKICITFERTFGPFTCVSEMRNEL